MSDIREHLDGYAPDSAGPAAWVRKCRAELRALESVARAAVAFNPPHGHDGNRAARIVGCPGCRLDRALARLDKVRGKRHDA